jgi:hypothetical protein
VHDTLPRLGLPLIQQGQAQKHVTHNEALELLDILVQLTVEAFEAIEPPADAEEGQVWALAAGATGAWLGQDGTLAAWANGGWLFVTPRPGWRAARADEVRVWTGEAWVLPKLPGLNELPGLGVGATHDSENRLAVASPAALFTHVGGDHRLTINKAATGHTASVVFQSDWSGRAEMGLAGEEDFSFKVSPDGAEWETGLRVAAADGRVTLPAGLTVQGTLNLPGGSVARAALAAGSARSVIGRATGSAGEVADIAAASDHQVLRRAGTSIGFGAVNLAQSAATTGLLPLSRGGTGAETAEAARSNLGLGTGATREVQSSVRDRTSSRVMLVGAFGLGTGGQWNDTDYDARFSPNGLEFGFHSTAGAPPDSPNGFQTSVLHMGNMWGRGQIAIPNNGGMFVRWGNDKEWRQVFHNGNLLGPVSQSAGVPTGAIIERGSNVNGIFVRFADGTQICAHRINLGPLDAGDGTFATPYRHALGKSWTFPAAFSAVPRVSVAPFVEGGGADPYAQAVTAGFANVTAAQLSAIRAFRTNSSNDPGDILVEVMAFGRWF